MIYGADIVCDIVKALGDSEPVLFQRNGVLCAISESGFGMVSYGLFFNNQVNRDYSGEFTKISEWEKTDEEIDKNKLKFAEGEEERIRPLMFSPDDISFTLEDIANAAKELGKIDDDSKIRIIDYNSCYHSHKYGYADVWLDSASVMDKRRYLELVREREAKILEGFLRFKGRDGFGFGDAYSRLTKPDCLIVTPNLMLSFPRKGEHVPWDKKTRFSHEYGKTILTNYENIDYYKEFPFASRLTVNAQKINFRTAPAGRRVIRELKSGLEREIDVVEGFLPQLQEFTDELNKRHNDVCREQIELMAKILKK